MKKIGVLSVITLSIIIIVLFVFNYNNFDIKKFVVKETDVLIYINSQKMFSEMREIIKKDTKQRDRESKEVDIKFFSKAIRNIFVMHFNNASLNSLPYDSGVVIGIDTGKYYPIAKFYLGHYFKKDKFGIYSIKEKSGLYTMTEHRLKDSNIRILPYKGLLLVSFSDITLLKYKKMVQSNKLNSEFIRKCNEYKNKDIYVLADLKKYFSMFFEGNRLINELSFFTAEVEYFKERGAFTLNAKLTGSGDLFKLLSTDKVKNRKLDKYIQKGDIYIANNDLQNLVYVLANYYDEQFRQDFVTKIEEVFGYNIIDVFGLFNKEMIVSLRDWNIQGLVLLKDDNAARNYFQDVMVGKGIYNLEGMKFFIDNGKMFFNKKYMSPIKDSVSLSNNTFLYADTEIKNFGVFRRYEDIWCKIELKDNRDNFEGTITLDDENMNNLIIKIFKNFGIGGI